MDKYYQILGLNPGASEEEMKEAYRDLVTVWHPDRFSNNPRLRHKANERIKEINIAYEKLKSRFARETSTTSDGKSHDRSQSPQHNPPPPSEEKQQTETSDNLHSGSRPRKKSLLVEYARGSLLSSSGDGCCNPIVLYSIPNFLSTTNKSNRLYWNCLRTLFFFSTGTANLHCTTQYTSCRSTSPENREKLKDLLENIQQANLAKDITLFMSCYAGDCAPRGCA